MSKKLQWSLVGVSVFMLIVLVVIFKAVKISGSAMDPKYKSGEKYLALRKSFFKPQRGDVITYVYAAYPEFTWMGRIVGMPSDKIVIKGGKILLNGQLLSEDYLTPGTVTNVTDKAEYDRIDSNKNVTVKGVTLFKEGQELDVPNDSYFILGDNRTQSVDSRGMGFVRGIDINAKLVFKY